MSIWDGRLAVFDLETTGVDVEHSRIVSACIAVIDPDGSPVTRWDWLADPGIEIPEGASDVHGITTERARADGSPSAVVVAEVTQTLRTLFGLGIPLVVYNAPYDLTLLDRECRRNKLVPIELPSPVIDPLVIDKAVDRYRSGKRTLVAAAERYKVSHEDAHDAAADALAAGRVAQAMARAFPDELDVEPADLHGRQEIWYRQQAESFQSYIREKKGDATYVADASWPLRPLDDPMAFEDTQPIPVPPPRPSGNVPVLDFSQFRPRELSASRAKNRLEEESVVELIAEDDLFEAAASFSVPRIEPTPSETITVIATGSITTIVDPSDSEVSTGSTGGVSTGEGSTSGDANDAGAPAGKPAVLRIAAAIVTDENGRALLVRKTGTSMYMQPGGKIERGESALSALTRELNEELGLVVDPDETEYIGSFRADAANEANTIVRAEVFSFRTRVDPVAQAEIAELLWIDSIDGVEVDLAPLSRDELLPLWEQRRTSPF
ncbi:MAG TPA: exonuclease domain-containing protein [Pseudolysinimonas sp.]|nr:exonuclease domain-containing protein [Pseudolysinimonas sp.]